MSKGQEEERVWHSGDRTISENQGLPWVCGASRWGRLCQVASPDRQAVVSIHLSSCPTLSSPRWLVWQGSTSWLICTSVGFRYTSPSAMAPHFSALEADFRDVWLENTEVRPWGMGGTEKSAHSRVAWVCPSLGPEGWGERREHPRATSHQTPTPSVASTSSPGSQTPRDSLDVI